MQILPKDDAPGTAVPARSSCWAQVPKCPSAFGPGWAGRQWEDAVAPVSKSNAVLNALSQRIVTKLASHASSAKRVKLHSSCLCPQAASGTHSLPEL